MKRTFYIPEFPRKEQKTTTRKRQKKSKTKSVIATLLKHRLVQYRTNSLLNPKLTPPSTPRSAFQPPPLHQPQSSTSPASPTAPYVTPQAAHSSYASSPAHPRAPPPVSGGLPRHPLPRWKWRRTSPARQKGLERGRWAGGRRSRMLWWWWDGAWQGWGGAG